jgi:hypothetical protein
MSNPRDQLRFRLEIQAKYGREFNVTKSSAAMISCPFPHLAQPISFSAITADGAGSIRGVADSERFTLGLNQSQLSEGESNGPRKWIPGRSNCQILRDQPENPFTRHPGFMGADCPR